ncbi:uncharacterized protein LOC134250035 [Saccostrea cucullata]|uniref:uncharacterized protein LOC134250035 n=1 Tax=Saccostrea cuccullata TaxID=36930 RepID=UPI002ED417BC
MAERWKCYNEYTQVKLHRFHNDAYICSAAREYDICLNNILDDCKANPHVADVGLVISQAKHIQKEMKDIRKAHKCGACEKKHSLVAITLGLLYYFLTLKS